MKHNSCELRVLVNGRPIQEYEHEGNVFVEGRKGSDFVLEFINNTYSRVLFVPSVDGINILTGQPATAESNGYVVGSYSRVTIPGWKMNSGEAAKFFFNDKSGAYAEFATAGGAKNTGVIGALVYSEKVVHITPPQDIYPSIPRPRPLPYPYPYDPPRPRPWSPYDRYSFGMQNSLQTKGISSSSGMLSARGLEADNALGGSAAPAQPQNASINTVQTLDKFELGTGFGRKTEFRTTEVAFARDQVISQLNIFYDSIRNLIRRGIILEKYDLELPQAFPGIGCKPPPGYKG